ncbi:potassium channel family protein [Kitasatospora kazusensis]|uniref:Potassium channel family protein n=1 Tax=Kitasatospora kazusensis TaxID=407974 RepID=A0ABP5LZ09_9ACTN
MGDPDAAGPRRAAGRPASRLTTVRLVLNPVFSTAGLVAVYYLVPMGRSFTDGAFLGLAAGLAGVVLLLGWQIRRIVVSPHPRLRAVQSLAVTVPLFLLLFAAAYYLMDQTTPGSFNAPLTRTDSLYFTVTVFSTVGFGDIAADSEAARAVVTVQMVGDLLLLGVAARIVVGAVQTALRQQARKAGADDVSGPGRSGMPGTLPSPSLGAAGAGSQRTEVRDDDEDAAGPGEAGPG